MSNPKGPKKSRFLKKVQEQADHSKKLRPETLYISVYECLNISTFSLSDVKLWLIFIQIYSVDGSKLIHTVVI